jgi:hypothetical protein
MLEKVVDTVKKSLAPVTLALMVGCSPALRQNTIPDDYEPSIRTSMVFHLPGGYKCKGSALKPLLNLAALYNGDSKPGIKGDGARIYVSGSFDLIDFPDEVLIKACRFADINRNDWISGKEAKEAYRDEVERVTYSPQFNDSF